MIVVSDTTPLSELAKVGQMGLLGAIFGVVLIPQQVYDEVTTGSHPAAGLVPTTNWLQVQSITDTQRINTLLTTTNLDLGECAAIALAEEINADQLLLDDLAARRVAESRGLTVIGTMGILLLAKDQGLIESVRDVLDRLIGCGKHISQQLYQQVLEAAGE